MHYLSFNRVHGCPSYRIELVINGIRGVHNRIVQCRPSGLDGSETVHALLYPMQRLCRNAGGESHKYGERIGRDNDDDRRTLYVLKCTSYFLMTYVSHDIETVQGLSVAAQS